MILFGKYTEKRNYQKPYKTFPVTVSAPRYTSKALARIQSWWESVIEFPCYKFANNDSFITSTSNNASDRINNS